MSSAMNTADPTHPDWVRPEVADTSDELELVHDLLGGTKRMHERAAHYIRKWKEEKPEVWRIRAKIETVFEGLSRTLSAAVGMLWATPPQINWGSAETVMSPHWDNIDGAGAKGTVFAKRFTDASVRDGLGVILVDHPAPPIDPETKKPVQVTAEDEPRLNLRPTWSMYGRGRVLNWRTEVVNNQTVLTLLVLHEPTTLVDGPYGTRSVDRYRVLRLSETGATWEVFEKREEPGEEKFAPVPGQSGTFLNRAGQPATRIPVAIAYTGKTSAPLTAEIPLLGVAWANLSHWRQSTNLTFYRELASYPQPMVKGQLAPEKDQAGNTVAGRLRVGPMVPIHVSADGDFLWRELEGKSLDQVEKGVAEKLEQMGQMGISFLTPDKRAAETAEAKRLDAVAERSTLSTAAQGVEDALNLALEIHAWYEGIDKAGAPTLQLNRDFELGVMDPQTMVAWVKAAKELGIPIRLFIEAWKQGGHIHPDQDTEALEREMLANAAAAEAAREAEREVRMRELEDMEDAA